MSLLSEEIHLLLVELFPYAKIVKEYYIEYQGQRLFVDFYLPSYSLCVEVHGGQHDSFVQHFHVDADGWKRHKKRDRLKEEWAAINNMIYLVIREKDKPKSKEELLKAIRRSEDV